MCSIQTAPPSPAELDALIEPLAAHLDELAPLEQMAAIQRCRRRLDALEARALARQVTADGDARRARTLLQGVEVSRAEQGRRLSRARAVAANDDLAERVSVGELTAEHLELLDRAARRTGADAANDAELLDRVGGLHPDQAARVAERWVADHTDPQRCQAEHDRQRRLRSARRGTGPDGLASITLSGDRPTIDAAWRRIVQGADLSYRRAGGRELPADQHDTTFTQRCFDAAADLLSGSSAIAGRVGRPTIIVTATVDELADSTGARQIGTGPIAPSVIDRHRCNADLVGAVFDRRGQVLWLGRSQRTVSAAQWLALVARDQGCVRCGADHQRCEAHHLVPWNAPRAGGTDLDNLALVCGPCHHELHDRGLALERDPTAAAPAEGQPPVWHTRTARPDERAPYRPPPPAERAPAA